MKTTNKEFKTIVENYLTARIEGYEESETFQEKLLDVIKEYNNASDPRQTPKENFTHFLQGGSSTINIPFATAVIELDYMTWFVSAGMEYRELESDRIEELYYYFLYRALSDICKKEMIIFQ